MILAGKLQFLATVICWLFYLSIVSVGQDFLSYQWDTLLLEVGFLSIFICPWSLRRKSNETPSTLFVWLFRVLVFKLEFSSGIVKLASKDPSWRSLSALNYHYETQPIPTIGGWFFHQLPQGFHEVSTAFILTSQLIFPFLIFATRKWRIFYFFLIVSIQCLIAITGNYGFFNILTIVLSFFLVDDIFIKKIFLIFKFQTGKPLLSHINIKKRILLNFVGLALLILSFINVYSLVFKFQLPNLIHKTIVSLQPFHLNNSYGLFAVMTKNRPEIILEGSNDLKNWATYKFKWKAGELNRFPFYVAPHQPRLDWQMWFAALGSFNHNSWFISFLEKILNGSEDVLNLLEYNPFQTSPPRYLRTTAYDYHFTSWKEKNKSGLWWKRSSRRAYSPIITTPFLKHQEKK